MKITRYKRVQRILLFYRHNFGFAHVGSTSGTSKRPIVVLADGTFCKAALDNQLNLQEQLRVYFNQEVKILTTSCVVRELELLGGEFYGALHIAKQYKKVSCKHQVKYDEPTPAADCICKVVGKNNEDQYFVATQDPELTENIKSTVAACPILFIKYRTVLLDRPSPLALQIARSKTESKLNVEETEKKELKSLKRKLIGDDESKELPKKKRRKIRGPNPMSVKKRKKKPDASAKATESGERVGKKKKRKRKKRKENDGRVAVAGN